MQINKDHMLHLDLYVKSCVAELYINGIPVRRMDSEEENFHSLVAHHLVQDGSNELEIVISPGDTPANAKNAGSNRKINEDAKACMQLVAYPVGAFAGDTESGTVQMELNWENDASSSAQISAPHIERTSKDLGTLLGMPTWSKLSVIDLEKSTQEIATTIADIHQAFENGNSQIICEYFKPQLSEAGRTLPEYGEENFREDLAFDIEDNRGKDDWVVPLNTNEHDFRLCADGKLIEIIDRNWEPTIRTKADADGNVYPLPIFLGQNEGQWQVYL
ncbi:Uncharacterised protein [BD1-7 clade bacterium]|uniref:Uncharacterized protein n=1 Tax=BD1-7 clade bacterium TaxID=2029982 RepID=A0A5S9QVD2_9GAMM|nr:Uncharacterised protein [BD1-7 clade bacterium]